MTDSGFPNYLYVSPNKTKQYLAQMPNPVLVKTASETTVAIIPHVVEQKGTIEFEEERRRSVFRDVKTVVDDVGRRGLSVRFETS
jgi:hypothetical protein